ncbi:jg19026 [Pararge aegeria aegeria]|uniref:Jg19026 protein n=1 Tax=Pararge aegeria aegeria TaxID=348720 RepID=A0A8S4R4L4_9NEOP|nr:jg19026 [Pararge aegeria aegeria]
MADTCFICDDTVTVDIDEQTRVKYRDVVGKNLIQDCQLCYLCCHVLNKLALFKYICLQKTSQYPGLLSKKYYPIKLQKSDLEIHILCPEKCYEYNQIHSNKSYQFNHSDDSNDSVDTRYANDSDNENLNHHNEIVYNHNIINNDIEYINSDRQNINSDKIVISGCDNFYDNIKEHNAIDELHCDVKNDNRNDDEVIKLTDIDTVLNADLNGQSIDYNIGNYDKMNDLNNQDNRITGDTPVNDDHTNLYDVKIEIDNENYSGANKNDNFEKEIVFNAESKMEETADDSKVVKKSKKKSDRGFKRIILNLDKQKIELEANRKKKSYIEAEFKCYNCALSFLFKDTYQAHMMRHEESNGEYQCVTCTLRFATPALLRIHAASHTERYLCRKCGECLRPRVKRRHACQQPREPQSVACHLCGNLLKDANGLQQHLKRVHANKSSGRRYACNVCGDSYTRQGALRTHMIKHINRKFHCDQCPGTYSSPYTLTQHKKTHDAGGVTHYCDTCGAGYASRKSLLAHMRNTSNHSTTTYECPICSRVCPNQKSLASHIQCVHSTRKDFTCSLCPARYSNRKSLVRHAVAHTTQKPARIVVCHLCGTNFKDNSKLNRHLREVCKKSKEEQLLAMYD